MTYSIASPFGQNVADDMQPWMTDHLGWLIDAIGSMFDETYSIVGEQGNDGDAGYVPGFGALFDIDLAPANALGYLGQFVGVSIPAGTDAATARALVRAESGFQRGTLAAIQAVATRFALAGQTAIVQERATLAGPPDPYHFLVAFMPVVGGPTIASVSATIASDNATISTLNEAGLRAALDAVKPGGVFYDIEQVPGYTINLATGTIAGDAMTINQTINIHP